MGFLNVVAIHVKFTGKSDQYQESLQVIAQKHSLKRFRNSIYYLLFIYYLFLLFRCLVTPHFHLIMDYFTKPVRQLLSLPTQ